MCVSVVLYGNSNRPYLTYFHRQIYRGLLAAAVSVQQCQNHFLLKSGHYTYVDAVANAVIQDWKRPHQNLNGFFLTMAK